MNKIYYYHGYVYSCKNDNQYFTIAGQYIDDAPVLELNIAICSLKDQFCKKIGRELATNRLNADIAFYPNLNIELTEDFMWYNTHSYKPFAKHMLDNISKYEGLIFNEIVKGIIADSQYEINNLKKRFNIK